MHQLCRHQGQAVEVRDIHGRVQRGILVGVDPARGIFMRSGFRTFFIPFFLIAAIFLISIGRRIF
ncbi:MULTISPECIES: hypothetical protein [unclassified Lysinibacillus]|uniref:hypothetical protein n=1 Tax=unclassified Lysinibacillus TaxID=2636778 RepID=UPI002555795E|nr:MULTISPECIES: hypothetical protein [unclassified Lysinibacillus]MDM5248432.1 hypothetical protein [Lysinibacillus sp. G4S2]